MSSNWRPDDSFLEKASGQMKGVKRVKDALKKNAVKTGGIITSRDKGIAAARRDLKRTTLPKGFQQWQLPVALGPKEDVVAFMTTGKPGAVIPKHSHKGDLFRIVLAGSVIHNRKELKPGDWMVVKEGEQYELKAGPKGMIVYHLYW